MGFRTICKTNKKTGKRSYVKYAGIEEYYRDSDKDKTTLAFYITYRDAFGARKKIKTEAKNRDEALLFLTETKTRIKREKKALQSDDLQLRKKVMNSNLTLDDVAKKYYDVVSIADVRKQNSTYRLHVSPMLGIMKIKGIRTSHIEKLNNELKKKEILRGAQKGSTLNPRTVKKIISNLRALFNWAIRESYIDKNPVDMKNIKTDKNEVGRVLTDDELEKLWSLEEWELKPRLYLFLRACYLTGARPSGVITIQVKHIDFDKNTIHIRAMKGGKAYKAKIYKDDFMQLLKKRIEEHTLSHDDYIFYPEQLYARATTPVEKKAIKITHTRYQKYADLLRKILSKHFNQNIGTYDLAYRVTVYTMRRTAATKIYKAKGILHAQKFLNHTEIDTTVKYLNIDNDLKEEEDNGL